MTDIDRLIAALRDERKLLNKEFPRNDAYGRGIKEGVDAALGYARQIKRGETPDVLQVRGMSGRAYHHIPAQGETA